MSVIETKTRRLANALASGWGYHCGVWQDRGPLCARMQLINMDAEDSVPALYATIDVVGDAHQFEGAGFGWRWHITIGGLEDTEFEGVGELVIEVLERNHLGDTEQVVADQMITLGRLLLSGVQTPQSVVR